MSIAVLFTPPATITLPVGGDPITGMRDYDAPYLAGFGQPNHAHGNPPWALPCVGAKPIGKSTGHIPVAAGG